MDANEVVTRFCESFAKSDLDETMHYVDAKCVYHNIPMDPIEGAEAIRNTLAGFGEMLGGLRFEVLHQVAQGDMVMNERVDHFTPPNGKPYGLPVTGVFEVKRGKIVAWRDYFDIKQFEKGTGINLG